MALLCCTGWKFITAVPSFTIWATSFTTCAVLTYIDEPINWESAVAYVQFQGKNLQSITFRPIALNNVGEGQPDIHNGLTNNQFLDTRGLPSPVTGARAGYILQRLAEASKPFGTKMEIKGDTAEIKLKAGISAGTPVHLRQVERGIPETRCSTESGESG